MSFVYETRRGFLATLIKAGESTSKAGKITTRFTASTEAPDRAEDVVVQDWNLTAFKANPVILWAHNSAENPVGRALSSGVESGNLAIEVQWDASEANRRGMLIAHQFAEGFLSAGSVGFRHGKRELRADLDKDHPHHQQLGEGVPRWQSGFRFSANELLEFSAVSIPMNQDALAQRGWAQKALTEDGKALAEHAQKAETREEQIRRILVELLPKVLVPTMLEHEDVRAALSGVYLSQQEPEPKHWLDSLPTKRESRYRLVSCGVTMRGRNLASLLNRLIREASDDDTPPSEIVAAMGAAAGIDAGTVNQILNNEIDCPPVERLEGFAEALSVRVQRLISAAESDGCEYEERSADPGTAKHWLDQLADSAPSDNLSHLFGE